MKKAWNLLVEDFNELKNKKGFIYKLPSIITSLRLLSTIIVPILFLLNLPIAAFSTILVGSLTDCVDGFVARKFNATSNFGAKLDAICDKFFIASITTSLAIISPSIINKVLSLVVLTNEAIIAKTNYNKMINNQKPKTSSIGRIKMVGMCVSLLLGFISVFVNILKIPAIIGLLGTIGLQIKTIQSYNDVEEIKEEIKQEENNIDITINNEKEKELLNLYTLKEALSKEETIEKEKRKDFRL